MWEAVRALIHSLRLGVILPLRLAIKAYGGTDKISHGYGQWYARHLRRYRFRRVTLLEIGVLAGDSLRVWRDVFPRARLVGLDIDPPVLDLGSRVRVVRGNQSSAADLDRAIEGLAAPSVVIDDGSHRGEHIWASFRHLFPLLRPGGVYVIEDLSTSYWADWGGAIPAPDDSGIGLVRALVDAVQTHAGVYDWGARAGAARPSSEFDAVAAVHLYPNMVVVRKA